MTLKNVPDVAALLLESQAVKIARVAHFGKAAK